MRLNDSKKWHTDIRDGLLEDGCVATGKKNH